MIKSSLILLILSSILFACGDSNRKLPYLGNRDFDGKDTVYHSIPNFSFINQDGDTLSQNDFTNKVYVSDFFFTSCPTICPTMKTQMLRIYEKFKENPEFGILSHTIDPNHDTTEVLKKYRDRLGVKGKTWQFVTGDQNAIYKIAQESYMVSAMEDSSAVNEGGFVHSGAFVLIDKEKHVRGVYDGTKEVEVSKLMKDIDLLLKK